jgi:uncharacterized protein (DUF1778 family)
MADIDQEPDFEHRRQVHPENGAEFDDCVARHLCHSLSHNLTPMSVTTTARRSDRLVARVTPEDKALLERAAGLEGCSVAVFVLSHVRAAAEEVVQRHDTTRLNQIESRRFVGALLAPVRQSTKRLRSALALHGKTVTER